MVDKYAPIIPYKEMGNIKLYSSMAELSDVISISKEYILNDFWIRYDVDNIISLFFYRKNSKLFKMTTLEGYCGDLFEKINVNTPECDITTLDDSFKYDEFDEVWESNKGVFIEIDPLIRKASWITIYIKELDNDDFDEAKWWLVHLTVNGEEIVTTVDHPFYVKNQGFIKAGELIVGDELLDVNGNVLLVENFDVELTEEPVKVYNFQVEDFHTYYVGENGVWVHNSSCTPAKKYLAEVDKETGDRLYKRTLEDGNEYQVRYTKGENGDYYARFEDFATHPDFPEAVYPSKKGLVLTGVEKEDLRMMLKNYGKPRGYTWHHLEDGKGMLLVETKIHSSFHHSGGATILRNIK